MKKKIYLLLALVVVLALVFVACETTEPVDTTPSIEVDTDGVDTDGEWSDEVI